jgi:hypothetical protein
MAMKRDYSRLSFRGLLSLGIILVVALGILPLARCYHSDKLPITIKEAAPTFSDEYITTPTEQPVKPPAIPDASTASLGPRTIAKALVQLPVIAGDPGDMSQTGAAQNVAVTHTSRSSVPAITTHAGIDSPSGADRHTPAPGTPSPGLTRQVLGFSTRGRPIEAYQIGDGPVRLAFIGGIHGGYEWNTILLAYEALDLLASHPERVPASVTIYIVPSANPDGQAAVVGHAGRFSVDEVASNTVRGRFNGNGVDLNRNWDCNWAPKGLWREREVNAGTEPFSEVETQILRDFLSAPPMDAVVFWHSAVPGVFLGRCDAILPQTRLLATAYADAAQYPVLDDFPAYMVTGDATDWLSSQGIAAFSVELRNHVDTDLCQNLAGVEAVLSHFRQLSVP